MIQYLKTYASTHLFYIVLIIVIGIFLHSWLGSHDALIRAEQQGKMSEEQVKASKEEIATLKQQIVDNDAKSAQQKAILEKLLAQVKTTQQVAQQLPSVAPSLPAPVAVQPDDSLVVPKTDVLPLFHELTTGKEAAVSLAQCKADYAVQQTIDKQKDGIIEQKQKELDGYKKAAKKGFWRKLGGGLKVGAAIALAAAIGHYA